MAAVFQNTGRALSDRQVYLNDLALADMAEPLGFESIWSVEHHFTGYTTCPDVVQFLSYMAGRTKNLRLGSMAGVFSYTGMAHEEAARNVRLFASSVMPELKRFDAGAPVDRSSPLGDHRLAIAAE